MAESTQYTLLRDGPAVQPFDVWVFRHFLWLHHSCLLAVTTMAVVTAMMGEDAGRAKRWFYHWPEKWDEDGGRSQWQFDRWPQEGRGGKAPASVQWQFRRWPEEVG